MNGIDSVSAKMDQDKPKGIIDNELSRLYETANQLRERLYTLQARLEGTMRPEEPNPNKPGLERPSAISSERTQRIMEITLVAEQGIRVVKNILDRIE